MRKRSEGLRGADRGVGEGEGASVGVGVGAGEGVGEGEEEIGFSRSERIS